MLGHLAAVAGFAWLAVGLLRQFVRPAEQRRRRDAERRLRLGAVEVGLALALLDLLFFAFVAVQVRYLFGGAERVESEIGLTYAEYARRGFFELVAVAALVLPLILAADWLLRADERRRAWAFRLPAGILVALLFVVMASALERMRLYQDAYGLTQPRVYATAFMLWLAAVFAWAALTVLRSRRREFAAGALAAALATVVGLNAANPDAFIARTNLDRAIERNGVLDARYLTGLSDDAVPVLVDRLPRLDLFSQGVIAAELLERRRDGDWRTWNYSRSRAAELVEARRAELARLTNVP